MAGGIILIAAVVFNLPLFEKLSGIVKPENVLTSPIIAAGLVIVVYAIGSVADLFGELFLIRAASGIFWAFQRAVHSESKRITSMFLAPVFAIQGMLSGFLGRTRFTIPIRKNLSPEGASYLNSMPPKVIEGLEHPVGDSAEVAIKYVVDQFLTEPDRRWARRQLGRARDVSAITTALLLILFGAFLTGEASVANSPEKENFEISSLLRELRDQHHDYHDLTMSMIENRVDLRAEIEESLVRAAKEDIANWRSVVIPSSDAIESTEAIKTEYEQLQTKRQHELEPIQARLLTDLRDFLQEYPDVYVMNGMSQIVAQVRTGLPFREMERVMYVTINVPSVIRSKAFDTPRIEQMRREIDAYQAAAVAEPDVEKFLGALTQFRRNFPDLYQLINLEQFEKLVNRVPGVSEANFLGKLDTTLRNWYLGPPPSELLDKIIVATAQYNGQIAAVQHRETLKKVYVTLYWLPFLILYFGFFLTLRNALVTIIEAQAQNKFRLAA